MGCGCGGAKRQAAQAQREKRGGGSTPPAKAPAAGFHDQGFTWNGPQRTAAEPAR